MPQSKYLVYIPEERGGFHAQVWHSDMTDGGNNSKLKSYKHFKILPEHSMLSIDTLRSLPQYQVTK